MKKTLIALLMLAAVVGCKTPNLPNIPDITPTNTVPPVVVVTNEVPDAEEWAEHPKQEYGPVYNTDNATFVQLGKGGMRWNPTTSKGKGKLIWPAKYTDSISWVTFWTPDGKTKANPKISHPHEAGNRERVYYPQPIESTPRTLRARAHRPGQTDLWTEIADTSKEEG